MLKKRSQVSVEFLTIFGFVFLMLIPLVIVFHLQSNETKDSLASNQIRNMGMKIIDKTEYVYYLGEPSKTTLKFMFPERIENISICNRELIFNYKTYNENIQPVIFISLVNITGNLSSGSGIHKIIIEARGDYVSITE
ncbi:hypothetical protein JXB41_04405 [Candidatus Woesearchaeota archaeon]|nr:hypothetical protein [Candidatus Woesearchaeota archaeon]